MSRSKLGSACAVVASSWVALASACSPTEDWSSNAREQALSAPEAPLVSSAAFTAAAAATMEGASAAEAGAGRGHHGEPADPLLALAKGRWVGSCDILLPGRADPVLSVGIERITEPTDDPNVFTWTIIYRSPDGDQVRPYLMRVDGTRPGKYILDEGGVFLTNYLVGGVLYSDFDVPGARLLSRDEIRHNRYDFEIQVSGTTPELVNDLGGGFVINAYRMNSIQRCSMRRAGRGHDD